MEHPDYESSSIKLPIALKFQEAVVDWFSAPNQPFLGDNLISLSHYFKYITSQCYQASHFVSVGTYSQLLGIASDLRNFVPREIIVQDLVSGLSQHDPKEFKELCEGSVDLAVRSLLMLDVGEMKHAYTGRRPLIWSTGALRDFVELVFPSTQKLDHVGVKLECSFTARNLEKVAGIKIRWTPNLADHLRVIDSGDSHGLFIFHHTSFLQHQQGNSIFPPGLIDETIQTIRLLFPRGDRRTRKWYRKLAKAKELDPSVIGCGTLRVDERQIEHFRYWHDRLVILKQVFDDSRPSTIYEWWHDRRNGVQWYNFWLTFWVLLLTVVFGVMQVVLGVLQLYKAYHPTPN